MITKITWTDILPIWQTYLWYNRTSPIEPTSAMTFDGNYDISQLTQPPTFFGYKINGEIVGVNSGHRCSDQSYRSRGLWVDENFRKQGIGKKLLLATITQAIAEECMFVWSYPRHTSWSTYQSAGFNLCGDWHASETSAQNAYCKIII